MDQYCWTRKDTVCTDDGCCDPVNEDLGCPDCDIGNLNPATYDGDDLLQGCTGPVTVVARDSGFDLVNNRMAAYGYSLDASFQGIVEPKEFLVNEERLSVTLNDELWHDLKVLSFDGFDGTHVENWLNESAMTFDDYIARANVLAFMLCALETIEVADVASRSVISTYTKCGKVDAFMTAVGAINAWFDYQSGNSFELFGDAMGSMASNADDLMDCLLSVPMSLQLHDDIMLKFISVSNTVTKLNHLYAAYIVFGKIMPTLFDLNTSLHEGNFDYCVAKGVVVGEECPPGANNYCWIKGYSSGVHCDGDVAVTCTKDDQFLMETGRVECADGCIEGSGCIGIAVCELNFCQANGYDSGDYCDGDDHVSCGMDGDCYVETERETCAGECDGGSGLCTGGCEIGSGPCCDPAGEFRSDTYVCDSSVTEYGCTSDACDGDGQTRTGKRYCSGNSVSCNGAYGDWGGWTLEIDCTELFKCTGGGIETSTTCELHVSECSAPCECSSGDCCDSCHYRPSTYACETEYEYRCETHGCSEDVERRERSRMCTGSSAICSAPFGIWGSWADSESCGSSEICEESGGSASCVSAECTSGGCCDDCRILDDSNTCDTDYNYSCSGDDCDDASVNRQTVTRYCSGSSRYCTGDYDYGGWSTIEWCDSDEVCDAGSGSCEESATCSVCSPIIWDAYPSAEVKWYGISIDWDDVPGASYYKVARTTGAQSTCPGIGLALPEIAFASNAIDDSPLGTTATYGVYAIVDEGSCYEYSCVGRVIVTP